MTSIVGKCDRALWKSITNNRTMKPWVTQQQLQYTTGDRYQLPVLISSRHDPKSWRKTGNTSKQVSVRAVEEIISWIKVSQNCWMSCTFKLSLLHSADRPFGLLTVIQTAMTGTMIYCSSLSCRYSNLMYLFNAVNTDKQTIRIACLFHK